MVLQFRQSRKMTRKGNRRRGGDMPAADVLQVSEETSQERFVVRTRETQVRSSAFQIATAVRVFAGPEGTKDLRCQHVAHEVLFEAPGGRTRTGSAVHLLLMPRDRLHDATQRSRARCLGDVE